MTWRQQAACSDAPTDLFYPANGALPATAAALCRACPVEGDCLAHALRHEPHGVWGGRSEKQRARMDRSRVVA